MRVFFTTFAIVEIEKQNNKLAYINTLNNKTMTAIAYVENHVGFRSLLVQSMERTKETYQFYLYDNGKDFVDRFPTEHYSPSIILLDIRMPEMNGYLTTKWIKKHYPYIPVLVFSDIVRTDAITAIIECGADGYTSKSNCTTMGHLESVITKMLKGENYFDDPELFERVKNDMNKIKEEDNEGINSITPGEMRVLNSLRSPKKLPERVEEMHLSVHTYNNHLKSITTKLKVNSSETLIKLAHKLGLIEM